MADEVDEEIALLERKRDALLAQSGRNRVGPLSLINSFGQGLGFGFSDEGAAALRAGVTAPFSNRSAGDIYREQLSTEEANLAATRSRYPKLSTAAEIGGALTSGVGLLRALPAATGMLQRIPPLLRSAGIGATQGAVYGAGAANTSGDSRLGGSAKGAAIGAIAAPAADLGARGLGWLVRAGSNVLGRMGANTPARQAERVIGQAMQADELGEASIREELERLGPRATIADLGENLSGLARAVTAKSSNARSLAAGLLNDRQTTQQATILRAAGMASDKLDDFKTAFSTFVNQRSSAAAPLYDEAYQAPLTITDKLRALVQRPSVNAALRRATNIVKDEGQYKGQLQLFDAVKQDLDDQIGVALRGGERNAARRLTLLKRELLSELDSQVPVYAQARELFSGEAALRDAASLGRSMLTTRVDLDAAEMAVGAMTQGERQSFQMGALRGMIDKLEATPANRNVAGRLIESTRAKEILRLAFPNAEAFKKFVQTAEAESQFAFTRGRVLGGSPTARIMEEVKNLESGAGVLSQLAQGRDFTAVGIQFLAKLGLGKDVSPETLNELAKVLFNRNLAPASISRMAPQATGPIIEPITRQVGAASGANALVSAGSGETFGDYVRRREGR